MVSLRRFLEPNMANSFAIEIDGLIMASFQEVSGLGSSIETYQINEGGYLAAHNFVTRAGYGDITFKRGLISNRSLFKWVILSQLDGVAERRNGAIIMLGDNGHERFRWYFAKALPVKWEGPSLNSMSSAIAIESLTIAVEWISMSPPKPEVPTPPPPRPEPPPKPEPEPEPLEDHSGIISFNRNGTDPDNSEFGTQNKEVIDATCDAIEQQIAQNGSATVTITGRNSNATLSPAEQAYAQEHTVKPRLDNTRAAIQQELLARGIDSSQVTFVQDNAGNSQAVAQTSGSSTDAGPTNRAVDINVSGP